MPTSFTDVPTSRQGVSSGTFPPESIALIEDFWNSRKTLTNIEELAHRIASSPRGQTNPVHVKKSRVTGKPVLFAGNRRRAAIQYINDNLETFQALYPHITGPQGLKYLDFTNSGMSDKDMIRHNLSENLDREPLSPIDMANTVLSLRQQGWEDAEIADSLRVQESYLEKIVAWLELNPEDQQALDAGLITRQLASEALKLPPEEAKKKLSEVKSGKKKSSQAVREIREDRKKKKEKSTGTGKTKVKKNRSENDEQEDSSLDFEALTDALIHLAEEYDLAFDLLNVILGESSGPDGKPQTVEDVVKFYNQDRYPRSDPRATDGEKGGKK